MHPPIVLSQIYARDTTNVIGINNKLPWKCSEDLKYFKDTTEYHIVVMGVNTYWSIVDQNSLMAPDIASRTIPLPNRISIVVSSTYEKVKNSLASFLIAKEHFKNTGSIVLCVTSVEEALKLAETLVEYLTSAPDILNDISENWGKKFTNEVFIIGGGQLFASTLHCVDKLYVNTLPLTVVPVSKFDKLIKYDPFSQDCNTDKGAWVVSNTDTRHNVIIELGNCKVYSTLSTTVYTRGT